MKRLHAGLATALVLAFGLPTTTWAHSGHVESALAAFVHPLTGGDHLAAMLLVGVLAARQTGARGAVLPLAFVLGAAAGAIGGLYGAGGAIWAEPTILASIVVLGLAAALALRAPVFTSAALCFLFGIAHGVAHSVELAGSAATALLAGLLIATASLHAVGFVAGRATVERLPGLTCAFGAAVGFGALVALVRFV